MEKSEYDVVIVGGGMVGCTLACLLANDPLCAHLQVAIVEASDKQPQVKQNQFDARVVALSNASQKILDSFDLWSGSSYSRQCPYKEMYVWDGDGTANIQFNCHDIREAKLGCIIENSVVLSALREKLKSFKQVTFIAPARVKDIDLASCEGDEQQLVHLETESEDCCLQTGLIVAADGAHSSVRNFIHIPTKEWDYGHSAIVTTVECEREHKQTAWQRFGARGPIALLPLSDDLDANKKGKYCSLVWSAETQLATKLMEMSDAEFCANLAKAFEYKLGNILNVDKRYALPLRQRHAKTYIQPGLALVGDAAHTIHPLAGQGVNLGFYDVRTLAKEIARGQHRRLPVSEFSILQRYERSRQSHNLLAMAAMEGFKRLFATQQPGVTWLRNTGMRMFNQQDWLKKKLMLLASG